MIAESLQRLRPELCQRLVRKTLVQQLQNRSPASLRAGYWAEHIKSMADSIQWEPNSPEFLVYEAISAGFDAAMEVRIISYHACLTFKNERKSVNACLFLIFSCIYF